MYEHPYLSYQVTDFEREQLEHAVERRRMLIERADQIVPRQVGPLGRMLRRMFGRAGATTAEAGVPVRASAGLSNERRGTAPCEPLTAR